MTMNHDDDFMQPDEFPAFDPDQPEDDKATPEKRRTTQRFSPLEEVDVFSLLTPDDASSGDGFDMDGFDEDEMYDTDGISTIEPARSPDDEIAAPAEPDATKTYIAQLEHKVTTLQHLLKVTTRLNMALLEADSKLDEILNYLMDAAAKITGSDGAAVLLWNNNRRQLFFAATSSDGPMHDIIGKPVPLDSIAGTIFGEQCAIQVDDVGRDPRHYNRIDQLTGFKTESLLGVPMISRGKVIGVLEVVNKRELPWTFMDRSNLELLAEEAAVAIEVAQLVVALRRANRDLREVDKLKSNFIAIASHELRTPLGVIMGYASFLMDEKDTDVNNHATKVMNSAVQLRGIIEGMVNLRYLKQKSSELNRKPMALQDVLDDIHRDMLTLSADITQYNVDFRRPTREEGAMQVNVDRSRITMAFINILNNAFAFTEKGGSITVAADLNESDVWISITDSGVGIEKKNLKKIFDEFFQVEDHMTRQHGGLGIGLSITKALVKAHGGRVWADSPGLGHGATFTVSLPLMQPEPTRREKAVTDYLKPPPGMDE